MLQILLNGLTRGLTDLAFLVLVVLAQAGVGFALFRTPAAQRRPWIKRAILASGALSVVVLTAGFLLMFARVSRYLPPDAGAWIRGAAMIWAALSLLWTVSLIAWILLAKIVKPRHSAGRRVFLNAAGAALVAAPVAAIGYGVFVQRMNIRLREQKIFIPGLAEDLNGLRIVQLTDIHLSAFLTEKELARCVAMANDTYAHLALVTGDMISASRDPLDACLKQLSGLRAEAGIYGCLGNHEIYANAEKYATLQGARLGVHYLRSQATRLKFGSTTMNVAGVDYQRFHTPYLTGMEQLIAPGMFNLLLSHNPDVFPVAAKQGYDLTVAGHTHGGQVRVEILREDLNVARFFTPYVDGLYQERGRSIFVSRGIGTIGLPARLGAPPEVALLRLCRS